MTYFADGEPCTYAVGRYPAGVRVVAIGWLDDKHPYREGPADSEFVRLLEDACRSHDGVQWLGPHFCELCIAAGNEPAHCTTDLIVVAPDGTWYHAPTMIIHYVTEHGYSPPEEFVAAISAGRFIDWWEGLAPLLEQHPDIDR